MPHRILHHTWSIRTVSPMAIPWNVTTLDDVGDELTDVLRLRHCGSQDDGTYATLSWITTSETTTTDDDDNDDDAGRSSSSSRIHVSHQPTRQHLHVDVRLADAPAAQLVLCFPQATSLEKDDRISSSRNNNKHPSSSVLLSSCAFALARGAHKILDTVLQWLESKTGCVFGPTFAPTPSQVARALARWTHWLVVVRNNKTTKDKQEPQPRPLELTFAMPFRGLSKLTVTIPPVALARLCQDVQHHRPFKRQKRQPEEQSGSDKEPELPDCIKESTTEESVNETLAQDASSPSHENKDDPDNDNKSSSSCAENDAENVHDDDEDEELPILKAIHCYMAEEFHISLQHSSLVRASSSIGVLGCDGRCKPLDAVMLHAVLSEISNMIREQILRTPPSETIARRQDDTV